MPEYLYPGVYVEETESGVRPIPGVSTSMDDSTWESLATEFRQAMRANVPSWTDANESDPGITLLDVFAFLAEGLLYRANPIPERGRTAALRAVAALAALGGARESGCGILQRPVFFTGRLLDAATLTAEQNYHREKLRRHIRALCGYGVVSGLGVSAEETTDPSGWSIVVAPGYAIDRHGEEISVPCPVRLSPPAQGDSALVTLRFWEQPCPPIPASDGTALATPCVEEACVLEIQLDVAPPAIALARLIRSEGRWQVDPTFPTPRASQTSG